MSSVLDEVVGTAQVRRGKLFIRHRAHFDAQVARLDERWILEISVRRLRATRSIQQNRFYWGVVVESLSEHTGYTPDEVHELLKQRFIPKKLALCDGNGEVKGEFVMGGSTRAMTTAEFHEYIESIRRFASEELGIIYLTPLTN